jgi:hypothetical protein
MRQHRSPPGMRRFARQVLIATLATLYGGVTAFGPALHALPGLNHVPTALTDLKGGSDRHVTPLADSHGDCPVCHFLMQGQVLGDPDLLGRIEVVEVRPADEIPLIAPPDLILLTHPRAPPAA